MSPTITIENATINDASNDFLNLFEISPELREQIRGMSLGMIISQTQLGFIKLTCVDRKLSFSFECFSKEKMEILIKRKKGCYEQIVKNILLPTVEAGFSILAVGGGAFKIASKTVSILARGMTGHLENLQRSELDGYEHSYKTEDQLAEQNKRRVQEGSQALDGCIHTMNKVGDASQELFQSIAAPA